MGTLGSTALKHFLENRRSTGLDKIRKERLIKMLSGEKFKWRSMENLSSAIGGDEETTAALLLEIGARKSMTGKRKILGRSAIWFDDRSG